ncbi:MAG: nucleotidyl transferase AbiEii/AbiGii toxin family protein [Oscillospiraceae bacterium]|nr:nucleotidyl transferase AbiEii/AbiGii toxin family protein [Oscillospiraceae bacterium]
MNVTAAEEWMYRVMKAVYDSGIPVDFKGSMVLRACLMEAGYSEEIRHTVDIDGDWYWEAPPSAGQLTQALQRALQKSGIELDVSLYRMYGEGRSAGFELTERSSGDVLFSMDIDINRPMRPTKIYEVGGFQFRGATPSQMLADKLSVVSTDRVFRRIKDVVDLYYMSKVFPFDRIQVIRLVQNSGRTLGDFHGFLLETAALKHAYEKFRFTGGVSREPFEPVYQAVRVYIQDVLPGGA